MKRIRNRLTLENIYVGILLVIFGGIVLQGPISVGFGVLFPHEALLIKSWAEILLVIDVVIVFVLLARKKQLQLLKQPLLLLMVGYVILHILLLAYHRQPTQSLVAGLIIDLRYILFFGLAYIAMKLFPQRSQLFLKVGIAGALVVVIFGLLQVTVLPKDILKYIGYSASTIQPYLTVDLNQHFIRINSTLRGPNPVGAYAVIILAVFAAYFFKKELPRSRNGQIMSAILSAGAVVLLWVSYSRSALIAGILSIIFIGILTSIKKVNKKTIWFGVAALVVIAGAVGLIAGSKFGSNILLHSNPNGGSAQKSDQGHISSLRTGITQMLSHPLGGGIGSTGSASLTGPSPLIIENQYLFVAHESGWLGLLLFMVIFVGILVMLWKKRQHPLVLGVFVSGVALGIIGLLLPVWEDDTVSLVWWALAAIALGRDHDRS